MNNLIIPTPGMGTFRLKGAALKNAIHYGLDAGFTHIDTAQIYDNEQDVGDALATSSIQRKDLFITTKVWFENFTKDKFIESVEKSLEKLQTDYVDLLLIHWPSPKNKVPMHEYLHELNACKYKHLTRAVGVSNFTSELLQQANSAQSSALIEVNQIEVHPYFQNRKLVNYCQSQGIKVVGYMPLGNKKILDDEVLTRIAPKYDATVAQIALAWQMQQDIIPIPASTSEMHLRENMNAKDITLTPEDMNTISKLDSNERMIDPDFAPDW